MCAFVAQKPTQKVAEEKETSARGEDEQEVEMIPDIEVREHEQLQSHPQGVVTQEPTSLEIFVEAAT